MRSLNAGIRMSLSKVAILPAFWFLAGCESKTPQPQQSVLAEAYGEFLYEQDVPRSVYEITNPEQRRIRMKNYARQWVREKVLLHEAREKVQSEMAEINRMADEYRKSLIIYRYQEWMIEQLLDTNVSEPDLWKYYNENAQNFSLKRNLARLDFMKLPADAPEIPEAATWFKRYGYEDSLKLRDYARRYALNYYFDDGSWLYFDEVAKEIPVKYYDEEVFLRSNKFVKLEDARYVYLLLIRDFRIKNSISPFEMEQQAIRQIILNQRKRRLLDNMEQKMLESALLKGDVAEH